MDFLGTQVCDHRVGSPIVSYILSTCPRCLGAGYYGSPGFDVHGKMSLVTQSDQLNQAIKKILIENMRTTGYGFNYNVITSTIDATTISSIKAEVVRCMNYLIKVQTQAVGLGVLYDPKERIAGINFLDVQQDTSDPRRVIVNLIVVNALNQITTPVVVALQR